MKTYDLFSKRQKRTRGEVPDVYQYDAIPHPLRVQIVHILKDAFGDLKFPAADYSFKHIGDVLCREYGLFRLEDRPATHFSAVVNFFTKTTETEKALDVIELAFGLINDLVRKKHYDFVDRAISPDDAIKELNQRFREHGIGYQFENGMIMRVDSQIMHAEVVRPAIMLLSDDMFGGANEEFLSAHGHYRTGKYKECLNDCLKAFESTLKAICKKRGWVVSAGDTSKRLIEIVLEKGLVPTFMQSHFTGLRTTLEAGLPTVRNRLSGHGQGAQEVVMPEYFAAYAIHLTATNILLLARADAEMK